MKRNHKVNGTIGFFVNDSLYSCLEYTSSCQRDTIIEDFMLKCKNIKDRVVIYYVISIDEESIGFPKKLSHKIEEPKQIVRPPSEYSNKQWDTI